MRRADLIIEYAPHASSFPAGDALFLGALAICFLAITAVVARMMGEGR